MAKNHPSTGAAGKSADTAGRSAVTGRFVQRPASKSGRITLQDAKSAVREVLRDEAGRIQQKK